MQYHRQETLDEFIAQNHCLSCRRVKDSGLPLFRCQDCLGTSLQCRECTVAQHRDNPFHVLKHWNGTFFEKACLHELGLHIQLGHHWSIVPWKQLLHVELFPAMVDQLKTCASFHLLKQFHALSGSGKISVYKYHNALKHLTDATGILRLKCKYKSLIHLVRQFAHIKLMQHAAGELALQCPACPQPGINLPADWDSAPPEYQFLYLLILALDANFRLKNLYWSSWEKDPGLHTGLAHFIEPTRYLEHVSRSCSGFRTLSHAETKSAVGLQATGVRMAVCACHEVIQPLAVADLQQGERYCNMDYIALSALKDSTAERYQVKTVFFSYDIACQWKKKFTERMSAFPPEMHIPSRIEFWYGIPKCHCKGHKLCCQCSFSMNIHTVSHTDGEGIEHCWAEINVTANSTKEMGLGNRYNTLDVQFAWHNWKKVIGLDLSEAQVLLTLKEDERQMALSDGVDKEDSNATACIEVALTVEDLQYVALLVYLLMLY
ncbi:hypothetical protein IW262DRAFT_1448408 [Armillaria fumosa]|nr:hypothetical protein IW262DRAFT_1448408 [Armillaria fumosa]